jgi:hypothetical protein
VRERGRDKRAKEGKNEIKRDAQKETQKYKIFLYINIYARTMRTVSVIGFGAPYSLRFLNLG